MTQFSFVRPREQQTATDKRALLTPAGHAIPSRRLPIDAGLFGERL